MFKNEVNGTAVQCKYYTSRWELIGEVYYCYLWKKNFPGHDTITEISGEHESGKSNDDVNALYIRSGRCDRVPKNFQNFYENIEGISLDTVKLKVLLKEDLEVFPKLRILEVISNELETLDGDIFKGNPNLERIDFSENKLKIIDKELLVPVTKVTYVDFSKNVCINKKAETKVQLQKLKEDLANLCAPTQQSLMHEREFRMFVIEKLNEISTKLNQLMSEKCEKKVTH